MLHILHQCYRYTFELVLHLNCTTLSQSESSIFLMYIVRWCIYSMSKLCIFHWTCLSGHFQNNLLILVVHRKRQVLRLFFGNGTFSNQDPYLSWQKNATFVSTCNRPTPWSMFSVSARKFYLRAKAVPEDLFRDQFFRKGANKLKATELRKKCIRVPRKMERFIKIYDKMYNKNSPKKAHMLIG